MNKSLFSTILLCVMASGFSTKVSAQETYLRASVGSMGVTSPEVTGTNMSLDGTGHATSARLGLGLKLTENLGIEADWFHVPGTSMNTPSGPAKYNGTVLTATLVGRLPLNERIEAIARAGIGRSRIDVSASDYSYHSESKKNPFVWGMGARFRISPSFAVTLDYDQLGKVGKYSNGNHVRVDMISAGVQFNF